MSNVARPATRRVLRGCPRTYTHKRLAPLPSIIQQRSYVSETKPTHATVNVNTAIKADQKVFMENVGQKLEELRLPSSGASADGSMSPAAGKVIHFQADM